MASPGKRSDVGKTYKRARHDEWELRKKRRLADETETSSPYELETPVSQPVSGITNPVPKKFMSGCTEAFPKESDLKKHEMGHTGGKPYQCGECSKRLARRGDLKRHERIHTGENQYECDWPGCTKKFTRGDLGRHVKKAHATAEH